MESRRQSCRGLIALGLILLSSSCGEEHPQTADAQAWPAGTVLVCAGDPIRADEVDPTAESLQALGPNFTQPHLRRMALTHVRLPLAAGRAQAANGRRAEARAEAAAYLELVSAGGPRPAEPAPGGPSEVLEGPQDVLGVPLWVLLQGLEIDTWSAVNELPGRFVVVRLVSRDEDPQPQREQYRAEIAAFPYVQDPMSLTSAALNADLIVVDPAWEALVPGSWRYHRPQGDSLGD